MSLLLIKDAFKWTFSHVRETFEILLIISVIICGWAYNRKVAELNKVNAEKEGLAAGLRQQITIRDGQIQTLTRQKDGSVIYKQLYVPPEGYVIVKEKDQQILQNEYASLLKQLQTATPAERPAIEKKIAQNLLNLDDTVTVKDHGWTAKPGAGLGWANNGIKVHVDLKYYFYKRYGAIIGGGENGVGLGLSRHLDDILWSHPQNIEFYFQYNPIVFHTWGQKEEIGFRFNF